MRVIKSAVLGCAFVLGACSIHPLPDDVTRRSTFQIVQKIRCEARDAITDISIRVLRSSDYPPTQALAEKVAAGELKVTDLFENAQYRKDLDPRTRGYFDVFVLSVVAFDFNFDIVESNDTQGSANFLKPLGFPSLVSLGVGANSRLDRENQRQFQIGDTFLELYELLSREECSALGVSVGNLVYPIIGKIGLEEVFETFIKLNSRSLDSSAPRAAGAADDVRKFIDTLTFTTTVGSSANPKIVLNPLSPPNRFALADAGVAMAVTRKDIHKVAITVLPGQPVTTLAEARQKAGVAKQRAFNQLDANRTQDFFNTQQQVQKALQGIPQ